MKKILVISWFYPPVNSSEGIVTYKLLNSSKYEYDVFTQKGNDSWSYGNKDELANNKNITCIYSDARDLMSWKSQAIDYFKKNKDKYDIVMTRSMPPESHKVGLAIKKIKPNIKWIASFGDPIDNNPYEKLIENGNPYKVDCTSSLRSIFNPSRIIKSILYKSSYAMKKILKKSNVEKKTIKQADLLIFNSNEQKEYMIKQNYTSKSLILPHSYEEKMYDNTVSKKNIKKTFAYIGHLDNIRTPNLIFKALNELKKEIPDLQEKIEFLFYGNMSSKDKVYIIDKELYNIVKYKGQIGYLSSLKIMKQADYLIHIDANLSKVLDHNIFFAAKLADYIGSGTPIISLTMIDGASADIIRDINGLILTYSVSDIKNYLKKLINNEYNINIIESEREKYSSKEVAKIFDENVKKLIDL